MPINPQSIKPPAKLVPKNFSPPNGHKYPVQLGDSWASLAATVGMGPWDLIRYNYPDLPVDLQLAAREVNWYLEHYVGCTLLTPDNRNYRFSPPGEIWLPNVAAALTPDQAARKQILTVLRDPVVRGMTFGVGYVMISATYYEDIAKAIEAGKIVVKVDPTLTNLAKYDGHYHPAVIKVAPIVYDNGLIIHECTHAIFDMLKLTSRVEQSEGFGYLSQALYAQLKYGHPARYPVPFHWPPFSWLSWQVIFDESRRLAGVLKTKHWVSEADAARLFGAFATTRGADYDTRVGKVETNDGL